MSNFIVTADGVEAYEGDTIYVYAAWMDRYVGYVIHAATDDHRVAFVDASPTVDSDNVYKKVAAEDAWSTRRATYSELMVQADEMDRAVDEYIDASGLGELPPFDEFRVVDIVSAAYRLGKKACEEGVGSTVGLGSQG